MTHTYTAKLRNPQQAHAAIAAAFQTVKPELMSGRAYDLTIKPVTRSSEAA